MFVNTQRAAYGIILYADSLAKLISTGISRAGRSITRVFIRALITGVFVPASVTAVVPPAILFLLIGGRTTCVFATANELSKLLIVELRIIGIIVGVLGGLVDLYVAVGIILSILDYLKVLK